MKRLIPLLLLALTILIPSSSSFGWGPVMMSGGVAGAPAGYATPALVQTAQSEYSGYDGVLAYATSPSAGSLLVCWVNGSSTVASTTVADNRNAGNWTACTEYNFETGTAVYGRFFYKANAAAGATTVTVSAPPSDPGMSIHEFSGIATSTPLDDEAGAGYGLSGTTASSGNVTPTQTHVLLVAACADEADAFDTSWSTGFTERTAEETHLHWTASRVLTAASGDYDVVVTRQAYPHEIVVLACFKAASL